MMACGVRRILLSAVILMAWAGSAHAQAIGSIFGKVTDTSGAVMPGVTVTVTGTGLQQPLVAVTSGTGAYQFPSVPIGTYTVSFELASFKKAMRQNVIITTGFNAGIDQKLQVGEMAEEVTVSAASPVVDLKKTITGQTFDSDILEKIPTARDVQQIVNMTPGIQLSGYNVGGSRSGQQLTFTSRGSGADVQWNLEGGAITDLSSNSSALYYNFDAFDQIQVTTGGGDVSVQSAGVSINLVTKSGSNVFKGTFNVTYENDGMQSNNVTEELFTQGAGGFLSGNPLYKIAVYSVEAGGPIMKDRLWYWGAWDYQDTNVGITNFFDPAKGSVCQDLIAAQNARQLSSAISYANFDQVQQCLKNDRTWITNLNAKVNYQLNAANKFAYLFVSDEKRRDSRGASSTTAVESTTQQYADKRYGIAYPVHQVQHTLVASDKLVFNNMFTYLGNGFFLDYQDYQTCGDSLYNGATDPLDYMTGSRANPDCLWNQQSLTNRTTGFNSRSLTNSYQTVRNTWELKSDGTYFLTNRLGGDHSLKFGVGWRKAPILSFSHYSGGARVSLQCTSNNINNCGSGARVAVGSGQAGLVPHQADLYRDQLLNNDWWTYYGYLQDSYSRGRWRLNGGLRYDWQQSKFLGGCVPANILRPDLLPAQCEEATQVDASNGRTIQSFGNWSPRLSVTYDLFGTGKTSVHASGSYYYDTKITLANSLSGLFTQTRLRWGPNTSSGACTGSSCWTDANLDGLVQINELTGTPTATNSARFVNGVLLPAGNIVDEDTKIARTREAIVGVQHELIENLAVGVDYIYRKYDRGTTNYTLGYEPGAPGYPLSQIYTGPLTYTDPITGLSAPYFVVCQGCTRPQADQVTMTNPNYQVYHGVDFTATKRFSNRWQMQMGLTLQTNPQYFPEGSNTFVNPTGRQFREGISTIPRYNFKANGSYTLPWEINASANFNLIQGDSRTTTIDGPGQVYGGTTGTISYTTLELEPRSTTRFEPVKLLDLGVQKSFRFANSKYQFRLMFDAFNVFNINTITSYSSGNRSRAGFTQPTAIIPPRVYRIGARVMF